jgi:hypothetical protein
MRQKKGYMMMGLVLVAVLSFAMIPSTANAYEDIASARIVMIGTYLSGGAAGIVVTITDEGAQPLFQGNRQYYLHPDLGKEGYATLLTAFSMDKNVYVRVESLDPLSLITIIYCNQ